MPKNIVFCADGTWEHPHDPDALAPADTNVYKFYKALLTSPTQLPHYDDGVGADGNPIHHLLGGAIGSGLFRKVKNGYMAITHAYQPGDQIYLFGFSRGAYTARSVAGMIAACGLPALDRFSQAAVDDAFTAYRSKDIEKRDELTKTYWNHKAAIRMVGVWDTVGALGIPMGPFSLLNDKLYGFLDTQLHPSIASAYQALSIDEKRREYAPTLWQQSSQAPSTQILEQVWFAGVHCDVGGGYPESSLSDITLTWLIEKAVAAGLEFDPDAIKKYKKPLQEALAMGTIHNSWGALWGFPKGRQVPVAASLGDSVIKRLNALKEYRPPNLPLPQPNGYTIVNVLS